MEEFFKTLEDSMIIYVYLGILTYRELIFKAFYRYLSNAAFVAIVHIISRS